MKIVVFDFDGTLTIKKSNLWKRIWQELGYDIGPNSYYISLLNRFFAKKLSHKEWCKLTLKAYKEKGFTIQKFDEIIDTIRLQNGALELIKYLYSKGIEIHIVSGNINYAINRILKENTQYISSIKANEFLFDKNGIISDIIGTKYDHEGKAKYILELCEKKNIGPNEVLFVGNSSNDEWVYLSGAKTICVNPDKTDINNNKIWNKIVYTENLLDLIKDIV
ncbi:MAG: HAD-IB family phosphatase [Clostridia bacterium]|nr:HAD-IB family phosphatase [Clostridia bacterium]